MSWGEYIKTVKTIDEQGDKIVENFKMLFPSVVDKHFYISPVKTFVDDTKIMDVSKNQNYKFIIGGEINLAVTLNSAYTDSDRYISLAVYVNENKVLDKKVTLQKGVSRKTYTYPIKIKSGNVLAFNYSSHGMGLSANFEIYGKIEKKGGAILNVE
jgi:hypothetical protein